MIYCATCGKAIPKDSRFCTFCGSTVPVVDPEKPNIAVPSAATPPNIQGSTASPNYTNSTHQTQHSHSLETTTTYRVPFFQNPGFYGALLILGGFFLPWFNMVPTFSGFELMKVYSGMEMTGGVIFVMILIALPVLAAVIVLLQSFTGSLGRSSGFFKWVGFLSFIFFLTLLGLGISDKSNGSSTFMGVDLNNPESVISVIGVGMWLTLLGVIVMLFNRRVKQHRN